MIGARELIGSLYGTWLLARFDARGFDYFEKTPGGFARSFLVAAAIAPFQLAHAVLIYPIARAKLAFVPFIVVQMLAYVLSWVSFPFLMLYVGDLLNRRERYYWQMVAYNWAQLLMALPLLVFAILFDVHVITAPAFSFLQVMWLTMFFVYSTFIARIGLQVGIFSAFGVVVLDFVLSLLSGQLISRI